LFADGDQLVVVEGRFEPLGVEIHENVVVETAAELAVTSPLSFSGTLDNKTTFSLIHSSLTISFLKKRWLPLPFICGELFSMTLSFLLRFLGFERTTFNSR